jgi:membrane protease YdiL (CAAX protease family)
MKRIYVARDSVEANLIRAELAARGIDVCLDGEAIASLQGVVPFAPSTSPSLWVADDTQAEEAVRQLVEWLRLEGKSETRRQWKCTNCGEILEEQFTACWNCETPRGDVPLFSCPVEPRDGDVDDVREPDEAPTQLAAPAVPNATTVLDVGVVLAVAVIPDLCSAMRPYQPDDRSFVADHTFYIVRALQVSAPTLYLMFRCGEPWRNFGICRPNWLTDLAVGVGVWLANLVAWEFVCNAFAGPIARLYDDAAINDWRPAASTVSRQVLFWASCLANGFAEELVMRAYLIPRFERLLRSTWLSVLLTTVLFAGYHAYQGMIGVVFAAVVGLVFGCAFCMLRRLWPIAVAHAIADLVARP